MNHHGKTKIFRPGSPINISYIYRWHGLVFPILNAIIVDPKSNFLDAAMSPMLHNYLYGLIIALFMLMFCGQPVKRVSDCNCNS